MNIKSIYYKREFDVVLNQQDDGSGLISHDSLRDVIYNQCEGIRVSFQPVDSNPAHCCVYCTMDDGNRRVTECGEALPSSLKTQIAQEYPWMMANQRAFDRAAILFLQLPGKYYSDAELNQSVKADPTPAPAASSTAAVDESIKAPARETTPERRPEPAKTAETPAPTVTPEPEPEPEPEFTPAAPVPSCGNVIMCLGKRYAGKNVTIAQVYAENRGFVDWAANKAIPQNDAERACQQACKDYLKFQASAGGSAAATPEGLSATKTDPVKPSAQAAPAPAADSTGGYDPAKVKITIGMSKGKLIGEADEKDVKWIATSYNPRTPEGKALKQAATDYLNMMAAAK